MTAYMHACVCVGCLLRSLFLPCICCLPLLWGYTAAHWLSLASRRVLPVRSHQRVVLCLPLHVAHCHAAAQQEAKLLPHGSLGCGMWVGHALCCLALPGSKQFCLQRLQLLTTTVALPGCPNPPHVLLTAAPLVVKSVVHRCVPLATDADHPPTSACCKYPAGRQPCSLPGLL